MLHESTLFVTSKASWIFIFEETSSEAGDWTETQVLVELKLASVYFAFRIPNQMPTNSHAVISNYQTGVAALYMKSPSTGLWGEEALVTCPATMLCGINNAVFGFSTHLQISNEQDVWIVSSGKTGMDASGPGGTTVYVNNTGVWTELTLLIGSEATSETFSGAYSIINDNTIYSPDIGASVIYVFRESVPAAQDWSEIAIIRGLTDVRMLAMQGGLMVVAGINDKGIEMVMETSVNTWEIVGTKKNINVGYFAYVHGDYVVLGDYEKPVVPVIFHIDWIDDCSVGPPHMCQNNGTCVDDYFNYTCACPAVYGSFYCTECLCQGTGTCEENDAGLGYYCDCYDVNAVGTLCDKPCNNGQVDVQDRDICNCTYPFYSGAEGKFCQKDIDDCASSPCQNHGICTDFGIELFPNHFNEFNCSCNNTGYHGHTCDISDCVSSPCLNNGTCDLFPALDGAMSIVCNCSDTGYEGDWCQTEVDECALSPCVNDGVCTDLLGDFTCDCTGTGYEGKTCSEDVDDCASSPCENDGTCQDKGTNKFKCTCNEFWEGDTCSVDVDDCLLTVKECLNGGACTDDPVNLGDVICDCSVSEGGFTGKYCNVPIEDACVTFYPCFNGGKCLVNELTKEMSCDCADTGYEGDVCDVQVYISECVSSPCLNEGQCYDPSDQEADLYCECVNGYFGDLCDLQACDDMPCENGGTCTNDMEGSYTCTCAENYSGAQCQVIDDDFVVADASSSSILTDAAESEGDDTTSNNAQNGDNNNTAVIIIIAIVAVGFVALIGWFAYFRVKAQLDKRVYAMPT